MLLSMAGSSERGFFSKTDRIKKEERHPMKKLSIALTCLPLLAAGAALAQTPTFAEDSDLLSPPELVLHQRPNLNPEWTWLTKDQSNGILLGSGYSDVLSLEKDGAFWRGKAVKDNASYHVAINRYAEVVGHIDRKSLIIATERNERAGNASKTIVATLNGPVAVPISRMASTELTPVRPTPTVMGEIGWTWMTEGHAVQILKGKGFTHVGTLKRDGQGIWRAKATKNDMAFRVALDGYSNVETQPDNQGGLAQGSPSE
jgi:hypothetical protein